MIQLILTIVIFIVICLFVYIGLDTLNNYITNLSNNIENKK